MDEKPEINSTSDGTPFSRKIGAKAKRRLKARSHANRGIFRGLGMMGLIGWSVVVPTLLGTALGIWLDRRDPGHRSWTLMLLVAGLMIGCWNAWQWVAREVQEIRDEQDNHDD